VRSHPYLLLTLAVFFWAGNFIFGRAFHAEIPPVALAFWRWFCAALLVTGPALRHLRQDRDALLAAWRPVLLLAALGIGAFNTLVYSGLQHTQAINALLIQSLMPVLIVLFTWLIFRERIRPLQGAGILVSLWGAVTIIARGEPTVLASLQFNRGDLLVGAAVLCYAGYSVLLRTRPAVHPLSFITVTFWLGALMILPLYLGESLAGRPLQVQPVALLVIGYVSIFPSILSYLCYNRGVAEIGANRAGLFIHLMPVFGSIMAIVFLGEQLIWHHLVGIALIAAGIVMAVRRGPAPLRA